MVGGGCGALRGRGPRGELRSPGRCGNSRLGFSHKFPKQKFPRLPWDGDTPGPCRHLPSGAPRPGVPGQCRAPGSVATGVIPGVPRVSGVWLCPRPGRGVQLLRHPVSPGTRARSWGSATDSAAPPRRDIRVATQGCQPGLSGTLSHWQ